MAGNQLAAGQRDLVVPFDPPVAEVSMFERLAKDPTVDVNKLKELIELQERIMRHQAKAEFDAAFAAMQGDLPVITEEGRIEVNGIVRSKYARFEDIQRAVKPILQQHGFSLRHRNRSLDGGKLLITGILSHRSGHSEEDEFECPADTSGAKNNIQAIGSTRSYGQRYTTIALLNIELRGADDDGRTAWTPAPEIVAPAGFEDFWTDLQAVAENGLPALETAWTDAGKTEKGRALKKHLITTNRSGWNTVKAKAATVKPS